MHHEEKPVERKFNMKTTKHAKNINRKRKKKKWIEQILNQIESKKIFQRQNKHKNNKGEKWKTVTEDKT